MRSHGIALYVLCIACCAACLLAVSSLLFVIGSRTKLNLTCCILSPPKFCNEVDESRSCRCIPKRHPLAQAQARGRRHSFCFCSRVVCALQSACDQQKEQCWRPARKQKKPSLQNVGGQPESKRSRRVRSSAAQEKTQSEYELYQDSLEGCDEAADTLDEVASGSDSQSLPE